MIHYGLNFKGRLSKISRKAEITFLEAEIMNHTVCIVWGFTFWIYLYIPIFSTLLFLNYNLTFTFTEMVVKIISDFLTANLTVNIQISNEMTHS